MALVGFDMLRATVRDRLWCEIDILAGFGAFKYAIVSVGLFVGALVLLLLFRVVWLCSCDCALVISDQRLVLGLRLG